MAFVIADPEDINPEWLTAILKQNGVIDSGNVAQITPILTQTLQVSRVCRLAIEYSGDASETAPATLFLKLSLPDKSANVNNRSEVEFYDQVGSRFAGPLVRCYHAAFSEETNGAHLLMEDLFETHTQSKDGQLPSPQQCEQAVASLAEFHAQWWEHPKLGIEIGRFFDAHWLDKFISDLERSIHDFLNFLGEGISVDRRRIYERMLLSSRTIWGRLTQPAGLTISNGDVHWWNFLFPKDPSVDRTRIIDWQLWHIDLGARDLAFLIALGGFAEERSAHELDLLKLYYRTLAANGVESYDWGHFWNDYRFSAIRSLNIPVIFWSQGKHEGTWRHAMDRAFQSFDELRCTDLLDA